MKKTKIILIICIVIAILLLIIPIPQTLKDGGTVYWHPIIPIYEIYVYHSECFDDEQTMEGWSLSLFGIEIYENTYFVE
ncbi:MAG: hypothetical protein J6Q82_07515 [Clostridia bacterium]|nr:hypothetical protein [Clostridia bacterium]